MHSQVDCLAADYSSSKVFSIHCYVYLKAGICQLFPQIIKLERHISLRANVEEMSIPV